MKKNKFYVLLSILTVVFLFSFAAMCNQCSAATEEEKTDIGEEEATEEETTTSEEEVSEERATEEETDIGEENTEEEEETEEEKVAEEDMEEPTIELEVYEGPLYSSADDVCYWRVKAKVKGVPTPKVEFNRDDSGGAWGSKKAQVNLNDPSETFTLAATATNPKGTAADSIDLNWECNRSPKITDIVMMGDHFVGVTYTVSVSASDPDGDTLSYNWSINGGSLSSTTGNAVDWTMPATAGDYQVTVEADDGNGGTDARTESVEVTNVPGPPVDVDLQIVTTEGGDIRNNQPPLCGSPIHRVGDCLNNYTYKGCISFDITGLSGANVNSAKLTISSNNQQGNLSNFKPLSILSVNWGVGLPSDFNMTGVVIGKANYHDFIVASSLLKNEIQDAINNGEQRFQIMLAFSGMATDNDNDFDMWIYNDSDIVLSINYNN
jgi:hypothetical protein